VLYAGVTENRRLALIRTLDFSKANP